MFSPGDFVVRRYPLLTAAGGLTGAFDAYATPGLPAFFQTSLTTVGNTTILTLRAELASNQRITPSGGLAFLTTEEWLERWREYRRRAPDRPAP